jgi:hypothetical protein
MRNTFILFLMLLVSFPSIGGKLDKGFEALLERDYFKAKELFEKVIEKETAGAAFGLCKVYAAEKSQFFNVDTAFKYILICDKAFKITPEKDLIELTGYDVTPATIRRERAKLAVYFFERASETHTVEAYQEFIKNHPNAEELEEAEKLRNHLAYVVAAEVNTMEGFEFYMENYPDANDFATAKKKFQLLEYQNSTTEGDASSYQAFINEKPENPYITDAQGVVYDLYTKDGMPGSYEKFISENPNNKHLNEAWLYLYKYKTSKFTPAAISEFMIDYPKYPDYETLNSDLELAKMTLIPAKEGKVWGFVDSAGAWVIKPKYNWASSFSEGKAVVGFFGQTVIIDKKGSFDAMFTDARAFKNNLSVVEVEEKLGVINYLGDTVISIIYDEMGAYSEGLIYAGLNDKFGYFNEDGKEVIPMEYEIAYDFKNGKAIVKKDGGYGVISLTGEVLLPTVYEWILADSNHYVVKQGSMYGLISATGDTLLPFEFNAIGTFNNNRAIAVKGSSFQFVNDHGEIAIKETFVFDETTMNYSSFHNGYARVKIDGKSGIIDVNGERVFPAIFNDIGYYDEVLTPINKTGKWGFANVAIELAIPYEYVYAYNFERGYAIVEDDTSKGLINEVNELIIPFGYSKIEVLDTNYVLVEKNGLIGVLSFSNEEIVPVDNQTANFDIDGVITFENNNKSIIFWLNTGTIIYREE